jgi:hypothetical protein
MTERPPRYPDISDILATKAAGRRQRAALSFGEKLDILDALRERVKPIVQAREGRAEQRRQRADALKLAALRHRIEAGAQALARGDYTEIEDGDLENLLEALRSPVGENEPR